MKSKDFRNTGLLAFWSPSRDLGHNFFLRSLTRARGIFHNAYPCRIFWAAHALCLSPLRYCDPRHTQLSFSHFLLTESICSPPQIQTSSNIRQRTEIHHTYTHTAICSSTTCRPLALLWTVLDQMPLSLARRARQLAVLVSLGAG